MWAKPRKLVGRAGLIAIHPCLVDPDLWSPTWMRSMCDWKPLILLAVMVKISPLAFTRALRNLVINAAIHGGDARVSLTAKAETALVTIGDDGPGIPEKDLSSVFETFFRADPARRRHIPGVGLGLAIAKEIIERQGGALAIENRKPSGLRQTLSFERHLTISPADAPPMRAYS